MSCVKKEILPTLCFILVLGLTVWVYLPGLEGPFLVDDYHNLEPLAALGGEMTPDGAISFIFGNSSGMLGRPVSMASFLLSDQDWPGHSFSFKYHNLLFHLLCGVLLFYFAFRVFLLTKISDKPALWLAVFVASFWLMHPYNVSTTLYVIQRMAQLAAIFSIAAMIIFIIGRQRLASDEKRGLLYIALALFVFVPLSVLSKESGILTLLFLILIEWLYFSSLNDNRVYRLLYWVCIVGPLIVLVGKLISRWPGFMRNYEFRSFSLVERLLTETRILLDYMYYIFVPRNYGTGLVHDDFVISKGLLEPVSTLWAILVILAFLILAVLVKNRVKALSFGVLFFFSAHLLESSFIPLELYFEHRNYLAMFGLLVVLAYGIYCLSTIESKRLGKTVAVFIAGFYLLGAAAVTHQSAKSWSNRFDLLTIWATEHPESLRAQRIYGQILGDHRDWYAEGLRLLERASERFPDDITLPMLMMINACKNDQTMPIELDELIQFSEKAYFHGGLVSVAKTFSDFFITGPCSDGNSEKAHKLVHKLEELPKMIGLRKSELLYHHAEKYAQQGKYGVAVLMLEETYKHEQTWLIPYAQAVYSMSSGMFDDALKYIDRALKVDERRKKFAHSNRDKIITLQQTISRLKESQDVRVRNSAVMTN